MAQRMYERIGFHEVAPFQLFTTATDFHL